MSKETEIMNAMDEALSAGYSREYQRMIQKYFNSLNTLDAYSVSDTLGNN